jgi:hypothetical protein
VTVTLRTITRERLLELADATGDPDRRDLYLDLAGRWKHNWIPLDAIAAAIKAKRMKGDGKRRPRAEWASSAAKSAGNLPRARGGGKSRLDPKGAASHASRSVLGGGRAKGPGRPNAGESRLRAEAAGVTPTPAAPKPRKESALLAEWRQLRAEQMQRFENPTARGGRPEEHRDYFGTGENMGHNAQEAPLTYRAFLESKSREKRAEKDAGDAHKAGVALGLKHSQAAKMGPEHDAELEALMNDHGRNEHLVAGGYADGQMLGEARAQAAAQRKAAAAEKRRGESAARKAEKDAQGAANRARTSENPRVIAAAGEAHRAAAHAHLAIGNDEAGVRHTEAAQAYLERARKLEEGQRRLDALGKRPTPAAPTGTLEAARPSVGDRVTIHNVGVTGSQSARYVGDDVNGKPKVEYSSGGQLVRTSIRPDQMTRQEQPASAPSPARLAEQVGTTERDASLNPQAAQALAAHNLKIGARVTYSSRQPVPGGGANVVVPQRGEWEITGLARNGQVRIRDTQHGSYVDAEPGLLKPAGKATAPTAAGAAPDFRSLSMDELQRHVRLGNKWASQANAEIGRRDDLADPTGLQRRAAGIRPHLDVSKDTPPQSTAEPITVRKVGNSWLAEQDNGRNVSSVRVPHNPSLSDAENKAAARRALERSRPAPEPPARHLQSVGTPKSEAAAGGARARSLPASDKLSGVHSETYRGERLSVRPAPGRPGYLQASINGHVVNMPIARSNADAVRQLDSLRGTVDDAHARPGNYHNGAGETSYGMKLPKPGGGDPKGEAAGKAAPGAGSHITVEHSGDGTTVHGTTRADTEQQAALKAQGFRWSRNLGAWYLPRTQRESTREGRCARSRRTRRSPAPPSTAATWPGQAPVRTAPPPGSTAPGSSPTCIRNGRCRPRRKPNAGSAPRTTSATGSRWGSRSW